MYEFIQSGELKAQAKRLLNFRIPLVLVIIINLVLIARIPTPGQAQAKADLQRHRMAAANIADAEVARHDATPPPPDVPPPLPPEVATDAAAQHDQSYWPDHPQLAGGASSTGASTDTTHPLQPTYASNRDPFDEQPGTPNKATGNADPSQLTAAAVRPLAIACQKTTQQLAQRWQQAASGVLAQAQTNGEQMWANARWVAAAVSSASSAAEPPAGHTDNSPSRVTASFQGLEVRNPIENGKPVRLLVNERLCELHPGEAHEYAPAEQWRIQFHRGGEFEDVDQVIMPGHYHFVVTPRGWDLTPARP
jgi:hypothetical protein